MTYLMMSKPISIKRRWESNGKKYWSFNDNNYIVSHNEKTMLISCSCHNGAVVGANNKQLCYHKKFVFNIKDGKYKRKSNKDEQ